MVWLNAAGLQLDAKKPSLGRACGERFNILPFEQGEHGGCSAIEVFEGV
jgi:hypothetical protein